MHGSTHLIIFYFVIRLFIHLIYFNYFLKSKLPLTMLIPVLLYLCTNHKIHNSVYSKCTFRIISIPLYSNVSTALNFYTTRWHGRYTAEMFGFKHHYAQDWYSFLRVQGNPNLMEITLPSHKCKKKMPMIKTVNQVFYMNI